MRLVDALRTGPRPRLALVGAGGKTSAMFRLGRELLENDPTCTVLLTTTTHLGAWQAGLADHHFAITSLSQLLDLRAALPGGLVLLSGPATTDERLAGLEGQLLDGVYDLARSENLPLLVEADGSRQRPLKAPAEHEPLIPTWVDQVVVVAGCSALEQPLTDSYVHRPELFARLSSLEEGQQVTVEAVGHVLSHSQGGLKGIPDGARRIALLNQAETPHRQAQALRLAGLLLPAFHSVLVASMSAASEAHGALPGVVPGTGRSPGFPIRGLSLPPVYAVHEQIAAVILAAGESSRFGQPKQLLPWRGKPLVTHVALTALSAGLWPVIVVCGAEADDVEAALAGLPVEVVYNPDWQVGQGTSVAAGVRGLPADTGGAVFLLADQPQTPPNLIRSLLELHSITLAPIIAPQVSGQRASPVLFDRATFPDLQKLSGETGGRALFARYRPAWLPWQDTAQLLDVDTPDDYQRLLELE